MRTFHVELNESQNGVEKTIREWDVEAIAQDDAIIIAAMDTNHAAAWQWQPSVNGDTLVDPETPRSFSRYYMATEN